MYKQNVVYKYTMEYYSAIKKRNNDIYSNMDEPRDSRTRCRKSEKESQIAYIIYL